jgi:hypothetical protein
LVDLADPQRKSFRAKSHRTIWQNILRIGGTVILSMFLAYVTEVYARHYWATWSLPGDYIADHIVPGSPPPNEFASLGKTLIVAFAVDSACYLIVISGLFLIIGKLRNKPGN